MTLDEDLAAAAALLTSGAFHQAEQAADTILAAHRGNQAAALLRGLAVAAMGETARAAPILVSVGQSNPTGQHPCTTFATMQPALPPRLIARQFEACLALAPEDIGLRLAWAERLIDTNQPDRAQDVLATLPDTVQTHHLRGLGLADQGEFARALGEFQRAVTLAPNAAACWSNLGMMLKTQGRFVEAFTAHDRAVTLAPDSPRFRVNRAVAHLKAGDWATAWPDYEARLALPSAPPLDHNKLLPVLRPNASLAGTTIVAMHEDGFGDTLQFSRYLPLLAERGARVVACVPPELEHLMRAIPGVDAVVTETGQLPPHDFVCPMFSLPAVFRSTVQTVPQMPSITLDADLRQRWAWRLPKGSPLKVGLVWAGQARPSAPGFTALDRRRSAGLAAFEPLFSTQGVYFISLQKGAPAREKRPISLTLFDPMPRARDFADTAAIIASLDLVISVDTSVVHLAGLMGVPVFLMDRYDNCWRWLHGRDDSPWYPKLTIFRQERPNDWSAPMARAAAALEAMVLRRGGPTPESATDCTREHQTLVA